VRQDKILFPFFASNETPGGLRIAIGKLLSLCGGEPIRGIYTSAIKNLLSSEHTADALVTLRGLALRGEYLFCSDNKG
jgi:hypothetical protein